MYLSKKSLGAIVCVSSTVLILLFVAFALYRYDHQRSASSIDGGHEPTAAELAAIACCSSIPHPLYKRCNYERVREIYAGLLEINYYMLQPNQSGSGGNASTMSGAWGDDEWVNFVRVQFESAFYHPHMQYHAQMETCVQGGHVEGLAARVNASTLTTECCKAADVKSECLHLCEQPLIVSGYKDVYRFAKRVTDLYSPNCFNTTVKAIYECAFGD